MDLLRNFEQISKADTALAGGKGASLGEMTKAGIPVPPGFVILSTVFEKFLEETDLNVEVDAILDSVNYKEIHTVENTSEKIKALILSAKMPKDIVIEIQKFFKKLNTNYVAIRSSATAEDSAAAAWAGQLESYLNTTEENLFENVKKCWASLFTPRAIFYRFEKDLHKQKISVAVVVQKMVESEKSGIAFSVHPVTQDRNQLIIEAGFGLGEAIVSGQITPDSYVVEKQPRRIIDKNVQTQSRGLYRAESGGNKWQDIPKRKGEEQVLTEKEILELSDIIIRIENHYGFPCDIEWAFGKEEFFIVQSRPITTLKELTRRFEKLFTRDFSLINLEYWYQGERYGLEEITKGAMYFNPLFIYRKNDGVSVYYDVNNPTTAVWPLFDYFRNKKNLFDELADKYLKDCKEMEEIIEGAQFGDIDLIFKKMAKNIWPIIAITVVLGKEDKNPGLEYIAARSLAIRSKTDKIEYAVSNKISELIREEYPSYKDYSDFLTLNDIKTRKIPSKEILEKRQKQYIYFEGNLYVDKQISDIEREYSIDVAKHTINEELQISSRSNKAGIEIKGQIAMSGRAVGKVKIVIKKSDISKVKAGDILVSPMTTPDFLPAIQKSAAFVTDEGGITSHAAITARELKKPCIIGTKTATKILKEDILVEVDADKGVVRVLAVAS